MFRSASSTDVDTCDTLINIKQDIMFIFYFFHFKFFSGLCRIVMYVVEKEDNINLISVNFHT